MSTRGSATPVHNFLYPTLLLLTNTPIMETPARERRSPKSAPPLAGCWFPLQSPQGSGSASGLRGGRPKPVDLATPPALDEG